MRRSLLAALASLFIALLALQPTAKAEAPNYVSVTGSGSTWSQVALDQWSRDVRRNGIVVNYTGNGSSAGRAEFRQGLTDFGVSEIPFQSHPTDGSAKEDPTRPFSYLPVVAGGTSFMYHLTQNGKRITGLRLSGETVAKIFTGQITNWSDAAITADMGGVKMPNRKITPVVRSDGSGTSAQFTLWLSKQYPGIWKHGMTSFFPSVRGAKAQNGSNGVSGYIAASYGDGAIGYVEYAYALNAGYPAAKVLNNSGYYVLPTASNVAVGLTKAQINTTPGPDFLTQILDGVYNNGDKRTYPLSSYSYMIVPRDKVSGSFNNEKGKTLSTFINYFLCGGQQKAPLLGYSPLPKNLVLAAYDQVEKIPGHIALPPRNGSFLDGCNNPTFKGGRNTLLDNAPYPPACDKKGSKPCAGGGVDTAQNGPTASTGPSAGPSGGPAGPGTGANAGGPGAPRSPNPSR